ncbi:MAG TPA: T9SS type A sorting domain-containing protein [Pyrinomonadaceae bacterium]|nr:T9SS type A sorting domain-containing protein [Pyrinomonadaceae bacterium]
MNTTGATGTSGGTTYTYSVGEAVVFNNSCSYTPGVVQPTCVCMVVSVSEDFDLKHSARFFPNPASSHVVVETDFPDFASFSISSLDGKTIKTEKFDYKPIDLGGLPVGTYLLRLSTADNQIFKTVKIIKQ